MEFISRSLLKSIKLGYFQTKQFSVTQSTRALPPFFWVLVKPISKLGAILFGRSFRKWWQKLPDKKRTIFFNHLKRNSRKYLAIGGGTTLVCSAFYLTHVEEHPITHRRRLILFTQKQLEEIEQHGVNKMLNNKKLLDLESPYAKRCFKVANNLFKANQSMACVRDINWNLTVIEDHSINNAVAFPSGRVLVYTGLIHFCKNDDELAAIIAHEMSHSILMHSAEKMSHRQLIDFLSIVLTGLLWTLIPSDSLAVLTQILSDRLFEICFSLPYSRFIEQEADEFGVQLAARACYDVRESVLFWKRMSTTQSPRASTLANKQEKEEATNNETKSRKSVDFLSTHPSHENRSDYLETLMPNALLLRKQCNCKELD